MTDFKASGAATKKFRWGARWRVPHPPNPRKLKARLRKREVPAGDLTLRRWADRAARPASPGPGPHRTATRYPGREPGISGRRIPPIGPSKHPLWRYAGRVLLAGLLLVMAFTIWIAVDEAQSSRLQARFLARYAQRLTFSAEQGAAPANHPAPSGPYDTRLGYSQLPEYLKSLAARGYKVTEQARISPAMAESMEFGLFPAYREKDQAGLTLVDCSGRPLYAARFPERVYDRFEEIPSPLVDTLLFVEDRELLDRKHPMRNPAVEWTRFGLAAFDQLWRLVDRSHQAGGASTLATQIEKYRHSPDGRTDSVRDKLRQMGSASVRAYLGGEDTLAARRRIATTYLNTVPLSARRRYGEINSFGDGLWVWYGRDFAEVNRLLLDTGGAAGRDGQRLRRKAEAFKQALSLMIAQRRPSFYLAEGRNELQALTDSYLRLLAAAGIIQPELRDAALPIALKFRDDAGEPPPASFVTRKAATAMRAHLSGLLGVSRLYDLDRLDLTASSTLAGNAQHAVTEALRELRDPAAVKARGLQGFRMLSPGDDPARITFSFTLFERTEGANLLRVQTDNFDQPFDINEGAKLNLGSTAKLRTLVLYLEIIAKLHQRYAGVSREGRAAVEADRRDALTRWALDYLSSARDGSLSAMLDAAMERRYSASPAEAFFTGGGVQRFENFDPKEDRQVPSVHEAFKHSINLVFVRLMRDIVRHYIHMSYPSPTSVLQDTADPRRREILSRFADREGRTFTYRFYRKYQGKSASDALELLLEQVRPTPKRLAVVFRALEPRSGFDEFNAFLRRQLPESSLPEALLRRLYDDYAPDRYSLADQGFLAGVHPLELWTVGFLRSNPDATLSQVVAASDAERQDVYVWLFKTRHKNAQDQRIQSLLEVEAFLEIGRDWRRLGYPFESLTPSYATAIGASGDRPGALAALVGIIVNRGMQLPVARIDNLHFAAATPFETRLEHRPGEAVRVLPEEIAEVVRRSLIDVVEGGTAQRLAQGLQMPDGTRVAVGGKTGTGDHRYEIYGRGAQRIASRIVNRSATFVFFIGDRFFGTVTAYVHEPYAARYKFTSALSVQLLKSLAPALAPLIENRMDGGQAACAD